MTHILAGSNCLKLKHDQFVHYKHTTFAVLLITSGLL